MIEFPPHIRTLHVATLVRSFPLLVLTTSYSGQVKNVDPVGSGVIVGPVVVGGVIVGSTDGNGDGASVEGAGVIWAVGKALGSGVGVVEGPMLGTTVGAAEGSGVGATLVG